MEFFRQKYWSKLPRTPPGDLPDPGVEPDEIELCRLKFKSVISCGLLAVTNLVSVLPKNIGRFVSPWFCDLGHFPFTY